MIYAFVDKIMCNIRKQTEDYDIDVITRYRNANDEDLIKSCTWKRDVELQSLIFLGT